MAVTANQTTSRADGNRGSGPIEEAVHIYDGTLCFYNSAGYIADVTASGVNEFAGIAIGEYDNSAGADADLYAEFWEEGEFELTGTGFGQTTVGAPIYASDNYTVTTTASGNVYIGECVRYISSTKIMVKLNVVAAEAAAFDSASLTTLTFAGATGEPTVNLTDNLADALSIKVSAGADLMVFTTTNSNEAILIGSAATQKLGFYGATVIVQPASGDQAALGAATTVGSNTGTAAAGLSLIGDTTSVNQAAALMNDFASLQEDIAAVFLLVNQLRSDLVDLGLIKGAA